MLQRIIKKTYIISLLFIGVLGYAQNPIEDIKLTPKGYFDKVFDRFGNQYDLKDLETGKDNIKDNSTSRSTVVSCDSGIFELYFETGSGMENTNDPSHNQRRDVVCRVFKDVSDFINTPLKNQGNTNKVRIWVRNGTNLGMPGNALGMATSFYTATRSANSFKGGIIDGEVWKTIMSGKNSYTNTIINSNFANFFSGNNSVNFYHGMMAFNFSNILWNTNLLANPNTNQYDLYSVVLHEITHALGFTSLLKEDGKSVYSIYGFDYYSRYDLFLKDNTGSTFLLTNNNNWSSMYNYSFNQQAIAETALHPGCNATPPISDTSSNITNCNTAIKYCGTSTVPVYTPTCFESGSSFSHFEDMCISSPFNGNDSYYVMSNANGMGIEYFKRFLKPEERNALIDIGYNLKTEYGNENIALNYNNYNTTPITINSPAGINDGFTTDMVYSFVGDINSPIIISGLLDNDHNAISFECLEDIFSIANLSTTSGGTDTTIEFTSSYPGIHVLRYVPKNIQEKKGNITYVFVYVSDNNICSTPYMCDLVLNGNFEQKSSIPTNTGQIENSCGWKPMSTYTTPDYLHAQSLATAIGVPNNHAGNQNDNVANNKAYAGIWAVQNWVDPSLGEYNETIYTKLKSPLLPNRTYKLEFDLSLAECASASAIKFQAYLSKTLIRTGGSNSITINNENTLLSNNMFSTVTNGWQKNTIVFTTGAIAGEQYLYLGVLNNAEYLSLTPASNNAVCGFQGTNNQTNYAYYYLDNVSLTEVPISLNLPATTCNDEVLTDLTVYLSSASANGSFSGPGIHNNNGMFTFNSTDAGVGTHMITYSYIDTSQCEITLSDTIQVNSTNTVTPSFTQIGSVCSGSSLNPLPTTSNNGITGTWTPALNNLSTTTYTFTPNPGQCAATTNLTITILPTNDPSCSVNSCTPNTTLSSPETESVVHKATNWIETNSNYTTSVGQDIKTKAGDYIYMKPNTHIKAGSLYLAKIETCTSTSRISEPEYLEKEKDNTINIYPNPTQDIFNIVTSDTKLKSIEIMSIEGKIIFSRNNLNLTSLEVDISKYQNGIYIINIVTNENNYISKKLVKN